MLEELYDEAYQRKVYEKCKFDEVFAEGRVEKKMDIASNMLRLGLFSKENIAAATGLSLEAINQLAAQGV